MATLTAGLPVKRGYYFSIDRWSVNPVERDGQTLPGDAGERFVAVPLPVAVMLAPALGAAFLMFMPFIGFYLMARTALRPVARVFGVSTAEIAASMSPGLQAGEAHLTGRRGQDRREAGGAGALDALEQEIAARRAARSAPSALARS